MDCPVVYVLSDSIGETGELVVKAAVSQFNSAKIDIRRIPFLNSPREVEDALLEAAACRAAVVYTLVRPDLKEALQVKNQELALKCVDVMGPILEALKLVTQTSPRYEPGLIRKTDEAYFNKIEAIDFAVKYDDGKQPWELVKADLVIIGVSRTSKTPLSMYLAYNGIKAANVPLIPEVTPPSELFELSSHKVIGLTVSPAHLFAVRKERLKTLGLAENVDYASLDRITEELHFAESIMHRIGCPVVNVTSRAVEETAAKVLEYYRKGAEK